MRISTTLALVLGATLLALAPAPAASALDAVRADSTGDGAGQDSAAGTGSVTWALQPATAEGPDGRVSLRHTVDPGTSASDLLAVTNYSDRPVTFAVYASDGTISSAGDFDLIPQDEAATGGGTWVQLGPIEGATERDGGGLLMRVPASSAAIVPVQIDVPANATPGDHAVGVVAELVPDDAGAVQLSSRVGVRVHLRVTGDIVASVVPEAVRTSYTPSWNPFAPGVLRVEYEVANPGNVRLGAQSIASVSAAFGLLPQERTHDQREILPGAAATAVIDVPVWPLILSWGEVTAAPQIVGEDVVEADLDAASTTFTAWTIPWSQLILIALLVGGFFLFRFARARGRDRVQARIDAAVAAATAAASAPSADPEPSTGDPEPPAADPEPAPAGAERG